MADNRGMSMKTSASMLAFDRAVRSSRKIKGNSVSRLRAYHTVSRTRPWASSGTIPSRRKAGDHYHASRVPRSGIFAESLGCNGCPIAPTATEVRDCRGKCFWPVQLCPRLVRWQQVSARSAQCRHPSLRVFHFPRVPQTYRPHLRWSENRTSLLRNALSHLSVFAW